MNHPQPKPAIDSGLGHWLGMSFYIVGLGLAIYGVIRLTIGLYEVFF